MEKLESVQYSAALAVTGASKGTSRDKLYWELGLESLSQQHWSRRLALFYKIFNDITPDYTRYLILQLPQAIYSIRNADVIGFSFSLHPFFLPHHLNVEVNQCQ